MVVVEAAVAVAIVVGWSVGGIGKGRFVPTRFESVPGAPKRFGHGDARTNE